MQLTLKIIRGCELVCDQGVICSFQETFHPENHTCKSPIFASNCKRRSVYSKNGRVTKYVCKIQCVSIQDPLNHYCNTVKQNLTENHAYKIF